MTDRDCVITRRFPAPARVLFRCFSEPAHMLKWFGPGDYPLAECKLDFRVGGRIEMVMRGPDGNLGPPFGGHYVAIEPDAKIAYTNQFLSEEGTEEPMVITVTFEEADGQTTVTMHTRFATEAQARRHLEMGFEGGVNVGLDQLAAYLPQVSA